MQRLSLIRRSVMRGEPTQVQLDFIKLRRRLDLKPGGRRKRRVFGKTLVGLKRKLAIVGMADRSESR